MNKKQMKIQREYELRFSETHEYRTGVWKILCNNFLNKYILPDQSVLDLGSGWGEFINNMNATKKYAIDLNPESESRLNKDIHFFQQDAGQDWILPADSMDVIFSSNFLEHLPSKDHVERAIIEAHRVLKCHGLIILLGPNIKYVKGAYWDFWDHHIPLTDISLSEALNLHGFKIKLNLPRFLPYSMSTGIRPYLFFIKAYLKLPFLWYFFGKQFFIIGEKTGR